MQHWAQGPCSQQCSCLVLCFSVSDFCSQTLNPDVKPGFPKKINPHDPGVLQAARHSVERFNNCTNDIFLFKESHISKALLQVRVGDTPTRPGCSGFCLTRGWPASARPCRVWPPAGRLTAAPQAAHEQPQPEAPGHSKKALRHLP